MKALICLNKVHVCKDRTFVFTAFIEGLHTFGIETNVIEICDFSTYKNPFDFVVIYGSGSLTLGANAAYKHNIIKHCKEKGIPHVKLEEAYIQRGKYWSVGIDGLAGDGQYLHDGLDPNRIDKITDFRPFEWSGDTLVITKQLERDASVGIPVTEYNSFIRSMITKYNNQGYDLRIREHPLANKTNEEKFIPIEKLLRHIRFLITYSSTTAVDAAITGVPFYVENKRSVVYDLRVEKINGKLPDYEEQRRVLNNVCHGQWTIAEMKNGTCWEYVRQLDKIKKIL